MYLSLSENVFLVGDELVLFSEKMKDMKSAFHTLYEATNKELEVLQHHMRVIPGTLARGIASLPDELLARVFELTRDLQSMGRRTISGRKLSHTCRRFRNIALKLPWLWRDVAFFQPQNEFEMCLSRSTAPCLSIKVDREDLANASLEDPTRVPFLDRLKAVLAHSIRWTEFTYENGSATETPEVLQQMREACFGLNLPYLHTLSVSYYMGRKLSGHHVPEFYASWNMPQLRHFEVYGFVPAPLPIVSLSSCDISFDIHSDADMHCFMAFLASVPSIKHLSFTFSASSTVHTEDLITHPTLELPLLETLAIHCYTIGEPLTVHLFTILQFPRLSKLRLELGPYRENDFANVADDLRVCLRPSIEHITEFSLVT